MMYKVIIVDDEAPMRRGLSKYINSLDIGFIVVECFEDGKEAIEYVDTHQVDLVITDIKMAEKSGIDLARHIFQNMINTTVVLISGYRDFEYAKLAIEYKVEYYMLKPTNPQETREILARIKKRLDENLKKDELLSAERKYFEDMLPLYTEQFFYELVVGGLYDVDQINKRAELLRLNIDPARSPCTIVEMKINNYDEYISKKWEYGIDGFNTAIKNFVLEGNKLAKFYLIMNKRGSMYIIAVATKNTLIEDFKKSIIQYFEDAKISFAEVFDLNIGIKFVMDFENLYAVPQYKKDNNQNQILGDIENLKDSLDMDLYLEKVKLVFDCIRLEEYEKARTVFSSFLKNIYSLGAYEAENRLDNFFDMLIDKINEYFVAIHIVKEKILILEPFKIEEFETSGMLMLDKLIKGCQAQNKVPDKEIITKALGYIEKNFSNDISLDDVANYVFLSSSYFSRVFKQCVGESFTDYIINLKMKKAAEYLANKKYKVYEISEMVGYSSSKHFIKMFKVYSGYTPKEYRLKMLNIEE